MADHLFVLMPPEISSTFTDVKETAYYSRSVSWAAENNITTGLNDGTGRFGAGMPCTRAMAVTFPYRCSKTK